MAENVGIHAFGGSGLETIAADDIANIKFIRVKLVEGADGVNDGDISATNPLPMSSAVAAAATLSNVASSASNVTLLSANTARTGAAVFNDSTEALYLKYGATASTSSFVVKMAAAAYFEFPVPVWTGRVDGLWDAANGSARVTEVT